MARRRSASFNRFISLLASVALVVGLLPAIALADDGTTYEVVVKGGTAVPNPVEAGQTVTVAASEPELGMYFKWWTCKEVDDVHFNTSNTTTFEMPEGPVNIVAVYDFVYIGALGQDVFDPIPNQAYIGSAIEPELKVELSGTDEILTKDKDYVVSYTNNVDVGTATATVTLQGKWLGSGQVTFKINAADISEAKVTVADQVYNGTELKPEAEVTWHDMTVSADDYTLEYTNNIRVGKATVTAKGIHNFDPKTSASGTFQIAKRPLTITADSAEKVYDGTPLTADNYSIEGMADGDRIASVKVEGSQTEVGSSANTVSEAKITNADGEDVTDCYSITYKPGTLTVTEKPTPPEAPVYQAVTGAGSTWTKESNSVLSFTFKRSESDEVTFDHFKGVEVDGKAVPEKDAAGRANWTARKGSVIVELQPAYLETLSVGKHKLTAKFDDADPVTVEFTVKAKPASTAKTGDALGGATNSASVVALVAGLLAIMSALALHRRREE